MVYREYMDNLTCSAPGCDHSAHTGDELYMHQACHPGAGVIALETKDAGVTIACAVCRKTVITIALDSKVGRTEHTERTPPCHPKSCYFVTYLNGKLSFVCKQCGALVKEANVKEDHG